MKIKKKLKQYSQHRVYKDTSEKLYRLSKKSGLYIIEILAELVDSKYAVIFDDK